jgi:uracil-DNA glycosylase family 4
MGEGLGHNEYLDGLPFRPQGAAGSLLETAFRLTRTSRSDYLIDNLVRCQPPHDQLLGMGYESSSIQYCQSVYGSRVLDNPNVRVVVALGALPFKYLSGLSGKKLGISDCRGYVIKSDVLDKLIIGSYHPAHIRRGKLAYTDYLVHDIRKALAVARGDYKFCTAEDYPNKYQLTPSIDDAKSFAYRVRDSSNLSLAVDIETPNSQEAEEDERDELEHEEITSIQFSLGSGEGIFFPWEGIYIKIAKAILKLMNRKLGFNFWHFDGPKLKSNQCVINGKIVDLMWKFHHLKPDLEMGLQKVASMCDFPFTWKHFANDNRMSKFYGVVDVDVLHWIEPKIEGVMKSMKVRTQNEINV